MKRVLMVAFQFPPYSGSVGVQRTLRFVQHLPQFGWTPAVLSAWPRAYESTDTASLAEIPEGITVLRSFALDAKRHLGVAGRYPAILARPDRWTTWVPAAVAEGLGLTRSFCPDVLWATYPIPSALRIGRLLHRISGLPWVADFRDPMAQDDYPTDRATWLSYKAIEEATISTAALSVFATHGAADMYRSRYPGFAGRIRVIENGYDEDSFAAVESAARTTGPLAANRITLLHSGVVYSPDRDPKNLFGALARLRRRGLLDPDRFRIRFRAPQFAAFLNGIASEMGVLDLIEVLPQVPYRQALEEMMRADALVLLAASTFNLQIPAKLYEYIRAERPIVGLTAVESNSAKLLRSVGLDYLAPLESIEQIEALLAEVLRALQSGRAKCPNRADVKQHSRQARTAELATLLETACARPSRSE